MGIGYREAMILLGMLLAMVLIVVGIVWSAGRAGKSSLKVAKKAQAPALEAYPFDAAISPSTSSTGYASTFARAGFKVVARRGPPRPIMRYDLKRVRHAGNQ